MQPRDAQEPVQKGNVQTRLQQHRQIVEPIVDKGKATENRIDLDLINFPALSVVTMRNVFEPLERGNWSTSTLPPDKGRGRMTC